MTQDNALLMPTVVDGIARITINRPEKRNAMTLAMWRELGEILGTWSERDDIRVLTLDGAGERSFCAGNDIGEYSEVRGTAQQRADYDAVTERAYTALRTFPRPTIASIRGYCIGGGLELALLCDLQVAAETAQFGIPPARLGIGYKLDDVALVLANVTPKHAKEILFTGDRFPASDAVRWGLVSRTVAESDLDDAVDALATRIAANAPLTVTALKRTIHEATTSTPDRELCARIVEACDTSGDRAEGQAAFAEKRAPRFKGR